MSKDFFIGGAAGIVSRTATAPLELLRLQIQNNYLKHNSLSYVIRNEGIRYLWKGNFTNCIRVFPQYATNFTLYKKFQTLFNPYIQNNNYLHLLSGGCSGVLSIMSIYPLETARSHLALQTNHSNYSGLADVFRKLSLRELYAGARLTCFGYGPWSAINFASYNYYTNIFHLYKEKSQHLFPLLCGGMAGCTAISVTYPTDLIRRRLQMQSFSSEVPRYNGVFHCIQKILQTDGVFGFYRGLSVSYIKSFPTIAIQFYSLEYLKEIFDKY